ncbi:MAG: hypothetical protein WCJ97_08045 [Phycisphaerae bacterium]
MTPFQFDPGIVPDADRVVERHRAWWNNECLDRPLVFLECDRARPTAPLLPLPDYFGFEEWGLTESQCEDLMRSIEAWPSR